MHLVTEFNSQASKAAGHGEVKGPPGGLAGVEGAWLGPSNMRFLPLQTSPKIFAARILNHLLLFVNQTLAQHRELLTGFREAAPPFRGQVLGSQEEGGG